jgi:hypothetical protein
MKGMPMEEMIDSIAAEVKAVPDTVLRLNGVTPGF